MAMTMYHGSRDEQIVLHEGLCLTGSYWNAVSYAMGARRFAHEVTVGLDGLTVLNLDEGFDRDENIAPADLDPAGFPGTDVLVFTDEDPQGREHETYRLLTPAALAAVTVVSAEDLDA
jgi:hypothetical protein